MEFNKNGEIYRYYNLDDILKLDLDEELRNELKTKFGKMVFFDSNGTCKVGRLSGLEKNYQLGAMYYIVVDSDNRKLFMPISQSITVI